MYKNNICKVSYSGSSSGGSPKKRHAMFRILCIERQFPRILHSIRKILQFGKTIVRYLSWNSLYMQSYACYCGCTSFSKLDRKCARACVLSYEYIIIILILYIYNICTLPVVFLVKIWSRKYAVQLYSPINILTTAACSCLTF